MEFSDDDPSVLVEQDARRIVATLTRWWSDVDPDDVEVSTLRLLGMAEAEIGAFVEADAHLREACRRAVAGGQAHLAAECRVSLANVVARQGRMRDAIEMLVDDIPLLTGAWSARARSNLAAILLHAGRHDEALTECERGIATAEEVGDTWSLSSLLNNRGLLHLGTGRLRSAAIDFEAAERLLIESGRERRASLVAQNLAVVTARLGDLRGAMTMFETTMRRQQAVKIENTSLLVDFAETLLLAGLSADAALSAHRALRSLDCSGNRMEIANVYLLLARCAFADGDARADAYCEQAVASYRELGDDRGVAVATRVKFLASVGQGGVGATPADPDLLSLPPVDLAEVAILASASSVPLDDEGGDSIDALVADARRLRSSGPPPSRLIGWCAEGVWRRRIGRPADVPAAVSAGIGLALDHAAVLGSADLRRSTLRRLDVLCEVGVGAALDRGDARSAVVLLDEVRTASADMACRPPLNGEAAELVAQHRIAAQGAESAAPESHAAAAALMSMDRLERRLRRAIMTSSPEPLGRTELVDFDELCALLGDRALVATTRDRGRMVVIVVVDGNTTVHHGGEAQSVARDTAELASALDRLAKVDVDAASPALIEALGESWRAPARRIEANVFSSALGVIADRRVVVVPDSGLAGLAWATLPGMRERPVELAPSASYWATARCRDDEPRRGHTVVAIGPDVDLRGVERRAIGSVSGGIRLLADGDATVARICSAVDGADTLLLSGHGRYVPAHPLLSSVRVADGELCWYDLDAVSTLPRTIVWNACQPGATSFGSNPFTTAAHALRRGCELVIGPVCTISDQVAVELTSRLLTCSGSDDLAATAAVFQAACHDDPRAWTGLGFVAVGWSGREAGGRSGSMRSARQGLARPVTTGMPA